MRIAIAGAGAVGRSIALELVANGHAVLLIDKEPRSVNPDRVPGATWLLADACEVAALEEAELQTCDVVIAATGDDVLDAEGLPRDPRADDVGVVAAADRREGVGALDASCAEDVPVEADAGDGHAAELVAQTAEGGGVLVDDGHGRAGLLEAVRQVRTHATAAHDDDVHGVPSAARLGQGERYRAAYLPGGTAAPNMTACPSRPMPSSV